MAKISNLYLQRLYAKMDKEKDRLMREICKNTPSCHSECIFPICMAVQLTWMKEWAQKGVIENSK